MSGSFAALILFLAAVNDILMERHLGGHNLVVWAACLGVLLAVSRALLGETTPVFDPEDAMAKVGRRSQQETRTRIGLLLLLPCLAPVCPIERNTPLASACHRS